MKLFFVLMVLVFVPITASAAEFYFEDERETLETTLRLRTLGEKVNAVSGVIKLPKGIDAFIATGRSAIVLWLEAPRIENNEIVFSGITPGGIEGDVTLFSFTLLSSSTQKIALSVTNAEIYKNDQTSSLVSTRSLPFMALVESNNEIVIKDTAEPLSFEPRLSKDSNIFSGAPFISFFTTDKESGIRGYEWGHVLWGDPKDGDWITAVTPLLVPKNAYFDAIYIKATDNAGNSKVVYIPGPYRYEVFGLGAIIILLALCALFLHARR